MSLVQRLYNQRNTFKQAIMGKRVVFHHVPKCAGTSVSRALRTRYFLSEESIAAPGTAAVMEQQYGKLDFSNLDDFNRIRRFRVELLHYMMWKDVYFIGGHVPFNTKAYEQFQGYNLITVLRDPVDRFISEYFYNFGRDHQSRIDLNFEAYLDSPLGRRNALKFCEYFCGETLLDITDPATMAEKAKANLAKFGVIGFTDKMEKFEQDIKRVLGIRVSFGVQNKRTKPDSDIDQIVTKELRKKVEELCSYDQLIYEFARQVTQ